MSDTSIARLSVNGECSWGNTMPIFSEETNRECKKNNKNGQCA